MKYFVAGIVTIVLGMVLLLAMHSLNGTIEEVSQKFGLENMGSSEIVALADDRKEEYTPGTTDESERALHTGEYGVVSKDIDYPNFDTGNRDVPKWKKDKSGLFGGYGTLILECTYTIHVRFDEDMKNAIKMGRTSITLEIDAKVESWYMAATRNSYSIWFKIFGSQVTIDNSKTYEGGDIFSGGAKVRYSETKELSSSDADGFDIVLYNYISVKYYALGGSTQLAAIKFTDVKLTCTPTFSIPNVSVGTANANAGNLLNLAGITSNKFSSISTPATAIVSPKDNYYFSGWTWSITGTAEAGWTPLVSDQYSINLKTKAPNLIPSTVTSVSLTANFTAISIENDSNEFVYNGSPQGPYVQNPGGYTAENRYKAGSAGEYALSAGGSSYSQALLDSADTSTHYWHYAKILRGSEVVGRTSDRNFIIRKAEPTITNVALTMNYGQSLGDVATDYFKKYTATLGSTLVAGTFAWTNPTYKPAYDITDASNFAFTFTPSDATNYKSKSGALTINQITINEGKLVIS
ncbi:MAG: hypothetical protein LBE09_04705, partial [Christensenellaceae bacterium]|nr:hypothetical protein [Christensenellaceae bacterium]